MKQEKSTLVSGFIKVTPEDNHILYLKEEGWAYDYHLPIGLFSSLVEVPLDELTREKTWVATDGYKFIRLDDPNGVLLDKVEIKENDSIINYVEILDNEKEDYDGTNN